METVIAHAQHRLPVRRKLELVLQVDRRDARHAVVARVAFRRAEQDRRGVDRIRRRHAQRRRARAVVASLAQVVSLLAAQFDAGQQLMPDAAGVHRPGQVGLVEQVGALGSVVVGANRDRPGRRHRARREHVLVELVVFGKAAAVAQRHAVAKVMVDDGREGIDANPGRAQFGIAEEGRHAGLERAAVLGGDAAVGGTVVAEMFVAEDDAGVGAGADREGRVDAGALDADAVAEALRILDHCIDAEGHAGIDRLAHVHGCAPVVPRAQRQRTAADRVPLRLLADTVDDAAGAATAEDHRVRAEDRFDAVDIVEVAEILDVVTHAVDVKIAGRVVAAEDSRVAVAFALRWRHAGHVTHHIRHALQPLVADQFLADHRDGLRRVAQQRVRFHCGRSRGDVVAGLAGADDRDFRQGLVAGLGVGAAAQH